MAAFDLLFFSKSEGLTIWSSSVCNCPKIWSLLDKVGALEWLAGGRGGAKGGGGGAGKDLVAETVKKDLKGGQFYGSSQALGLAFKKGPTVLPDSTFPHKGSQF